MPELSPVRIVLVRPEEPGNVGAVARILKNFGMNHLVLVAPAYDRPERAFTFAHGAEDVLESADYAATLDEALRGTADAWATTRRRGRKRSGGRSVRDAAGLAWDAAKGGRSVAWVFGPESRGLATDEVARCSGRVSIPTAPEQPSLNLSQAVAVCAYETYVARLSPGGAGRRIALLEQRNELYAHLESALLGIGFLHPHTAAPRMSALRAILERAELSEKEVALLRGIARQMAWAGEQERDG